MQPPENPIIEDKKKVKLYEPSFLICVAVVVGALLVGLASNKIAHMGDDNAVEELAEEVIKKETGLDIDLTPGSPEKEAKKLEFP